MQDDEGGGLSTSLFGGNGSSSSNGDIGIPDFNEDDYLDLSILNDAEESNFDSAGDGSKAQAGDAAEGDGGASNEGLAIGKQQQQLETAHVLNNKNATDTTNLPDPTLGSPTSKSQKATTDSQNQESSQQQQQQQQEEGHEQETNSNDSDRRSNTDNLEQNESSTSIAPSQSEPSKPLTDSPSTYGNGMKLPNGDSNGQASMFPGPTRDTNSISNSLIQTNANGYSMSPTSSAQPQLHSNRPPSPSKRSPTRSGTLALIPEEEETQQHQRDQQSRPANADAPSKDNVGAQPDQAESSRTSPSQNACGIASQPSDSQGGPKDASRQPFKMSIPPYVHSANEDKSKPPVAASPTFNSAPLKAPMPGQHAQALEVRRHLYALQIPTLLLVNAELVKGCIFLLEQHAKNSPEQAFSMEGTYSELVSRLSGNLGYLATITNTGGVPNNGSLPIPVLEPPVAASEYLKNLYNQLRTYFMMGQKGGFFNAAQLGPKSEKISPTASQHQRQPQVIRPPSPHKQQQQRASSGQAEANALTSVTGKRDRQQTEQDNQNAQLASKEESMDATSSAQDEAAAGIIGSSVPAKNSDNSQRGQTLQNADSQSQVAGPSQQSANLPQASTAAAAATSGPQPKRRKASQDSARAASLGGPQTPRMPNQQQQIPILPQAAGQQVASQAAENTGSLGQASNDQLQETSQPQQQTSTIPPHIQQHMQAVAAANAAQSPNTSLQQQASRFQQQQQQPPLRAPSAMSMQSPMSQQHSGTPEHFRQPSVQPVTPHASGQQMQMQNGLPQSFNQPRPPGAAGPSGYQQNQLQQSQMQGPGGQFAQAPPQLSQQQGQSGNIPENIEMLAQEMMRLQSMMASARQFKLNHDLYGKMPQEAKQQLELKLAEQENQFNQMRMIYDRHMNEQQREQSGQPNVPLGRRNAMSPQPAQQMQNLQQHQQRLSMQQASRPSQMSSMPPPQQPLQQSQRQASISSVQQQANVSNTGSPAASIHESPALTHASPHGMVRPGTSQSMRQGDGQMMPPPSRPGQPQEAGAAAGHMQQQMQRPMQYGQQQDYSNDGSSPARPPSVMSNPANHQQQAHFRVPSVNAYHPGAPSSVNGSPHNANFPSSPANSSTYASSPVAGQHMPPPGPSGQGGFNLMQQRARMSSLQGNQFARPPTPSSQQQQQQLQQQAQGRQGTPQQQPQPLQPQHTGGPSWQPGQPGTPQQQQQLQQPNMGPPSMPSQSQPQPPAPSGTPLQQQQAGPFPPMPAPMNMQQQQGLQAPMPMQGMQGQQQPQQPVGMHIPPQLYQNPQALHAYIAQVQAQAQAQGRPPFQLPPGLQMPGMGMSPQQGMMMGGPGPQQQQQQQQQLPPGQQGQPMAMSLPTGQLGGVVGGRVPPASLQQQGAAAPGGLPLHLFPTGFNANNPSHHHALQQYQQELQQQEQMQTLQRLKAQQSQQHQQGSPMPSNPINLQQQPIQPGHPQYEALMRQQQQMRMQQQGQAQGQMSPMNMQQQQQRMRQTSAAAQGQQGGSLPPQGIPMPQGSPPPQHMQQGMQQSLRGPPQQQQQQQQQQGQPPQLQGQPQGQQQGFNPNMAMQGRQMMPPSSLPQQGQQQQFQQAGQVPGQGQQQQRPMFPYAGQGGGPQNQQQQQQQPQNGQGMQQPPQQGGYPSQQQQQNQRTGPPQQQMPNQQQQQGQAQSSNNNNGQQQQQQPGSANSFDFDSYINIQ